MSRRGTHYEQAFEAYLQSRRLPYVQVDQTRKAMITTTGIKSFDFLIYPPRKTKIITDVKGRKLPFASYQKGYTGETWVTADDIEGMQSWLEVFGTDYTAVFVFAYWLENFRDRNAPTPENDIFLHDNRHYTFRIMEINAYRLAMRPRSPRWNTVYVPRRLFRLMSSPFLGYLRDN